MNIASPSAASAFLTATAGQSGPVRPTSPPENVSGSTDQEIGSRIGTMFGGVASKGLYQGSPKAVNETTLLPNPNSDLVGGTRPTITPGVRIDVASPDFDKPGPGAVKSG